MNSASEITQGQSELPHPARADTLAEGGASCLYFTWVGRMVRLTRRTCLTRLRAARRATRSERASGFPPGPRRARGPTPTRRS